MRRTNLVLKYAADYIRALPGSDYRFGINDLFLSIRELYWKTPSLKAAGKADGMIRLEIDGRSIYWPEKAGTGELSWIYGEVFYPPGINPSSYEYGRCTPAGRQWVIDAGAGEGFFSLQALERGAEKIIAVEPLKSLETSLKHTFRETSGPATCEVLNAALSDKPGTVYIKQDSSRFCAARTECGGNGEGPEVRATTVDVIFTEYGLSGSGLIKMDIEGAEMAALSGAAEVLRKNKPALSVAVYHGYRNALTCRDIIRDINPDYNCRFRGIYLKELPPRPYMLFAW